jgi:hypothetical protein
MQDATATLVHVLVGLATAALAVAKLVVGSGLKQAGSARRVHRSQQETVRGSVARRFDQQDSCGRR